MSQKKLSKAKSIRRTKRLTELAVCAVLLVTGAYLVKGAFDNSKKIGETDTAIQTETVPDITEPVTEPADPDRIIYSSSQVRTKDKFRGDLILVNSDHQYYTSGEEDLVSILEQNYASDISYFGTVDMTYTILRPVYENMVKMIGDFYEKYHNDSLIIYGSYRTTDFQRQLYEADLAATGNEESTRVAKPGFSEHESGYAFDFSTVPDYDYDGTGDYAWFTENSYKYGFILRYPESKESITKIQYEPWHFRYVGYPHAYYMTKNSLCMEEYMKLIEEHPYSGEHLEFTADDGQTYEVYFVASDDSAENTDVPVPSGLEYTVSGNNYSGFVVTAKKNAAGNQPAATTTTTTAAPTETTTEAQPAE